MCCFHSFISKPTVTYTITHTSPNTETTNNYKRNETGAGIQQSCQPCHETNSTHKTDTVQIHTHTHTHTALCKHTLSHNTL